MSNSKHTPASWSVDLDDNSIDVWGANNDAPIVKMDNPNEWNKLTQEEVVANAHLIAAAPDMLEALKAIWLSSNVGNLTELAEIAIAKAEGRAE
ncbi:hypothetical protein OAI07_01220 [Akkermansiaceae bacterium]|nr:hypothetical protein [Akkermansiaceae bacterium]